LVPIMFSAINTKRDLYVIVGAFILGAVASTAYGLLHPTAATAQQAGRLIGSLGDANEQACVLVATVALILGCAAALRSSRLKPLAILAFVIAVIGLVGTESRGGIIAFAIVILAGVAIGGRWRGVATVLLLFAVLGGATYVTVAAPQQDRLASTNSSGRNDLWKVGWRMFTAHPLLGVGAGSFPLVSSHYLDRPGTITSAIYIVDQPKVAHNIYLEQLADVGIPGLVAMLGVFAAALAAALRAARLFQRSGDERLELLARCCFLALVAFLAADFFLSNLVSKQLWLVIALCPALLKLAYARAQSPSD
jgi:O-antigen ligase